MLIQPTILKGYTMSVHLFGVENQGGGDTLALQTTQLPEELKAIYKPPVPIPHPGGHTEPETEHEKELLDYLHSRLRFAKASVRNSPDNLPMLREIEFLFQYGRFYSPRPLPKGLKAGRKQGCYLASQLHAADTGSLTYVEGYGLLGIGHAHAWCIDAEGEVIDRTWTGRKGRPLGQAYFGVPMDRDYVRELLLARKFADAFIMPAAFVE
ncbi:MAG TPA: hypothetical protein VN688_08460 [Gemmataceae bacterium]|nr:hypothetical protein [Gemmataceae bacterium]